MKMKFVEVIPIVTLLLTRVTAQEIQVNDHLTCMKVQEPSFSKNQKIVLKMMANPAQMDYSFKKCTIKSKGAIKFCIPSAKTVVEGYDDPSLGGLVPKYDPKRAIQNDLLCYKVRCSKPKKLPVLQKVVDQFTPKELVKSPRTLTINNSNIKEVCTPAWKIDEKGNIIIISEEKDQCDWIDFETDMELFQAALSPNGVIGDGSEKQCKIFDNRACSTCACDYYVRYTEDGGANWLGMSFQGVPNLGGSGCPAGGVGATTVTQTVDFLQKYYIDKGYCGCIADKCDWIDFETDKELFQAALSPNGVIGDGSEKQCKIFDNRACATCACDYYVRYTEDGGANWLGMSFEGVPNLGGTGCPAGGVGATTVTQTVDFLQKYYIDKGYCGCLYN